MFYLDWREVARVTFVDVEDLLRVPDHSFQVARQNDLKNNNNLFRRNKIEWFEIGRDLLHLKSKKKYK